MGIILSGCSHVWSWSNKQLCQCLFRRMCVEVIGPLICLRCPPSPPQLCRPAGHSRASEQPYFTLPSAPFRSCHWDLPHGEGAKGAGGRVGSCPSLLDMIRPVRGNVRPASTGLEMRFKALISTGWTSFLLNHWCQLGSFAAVGGRGGARQESRTILEVHHWLRGIRILSTLFFQVLCVLARSLILTHRPRSRVRKSRWGMKPWRRFKRVINGKQFFKVQDDQRRIEAWAPFMSAAAFWTTPGSEAERHFFHKRTGASILTRKLN